jgi:ribosome-associated translation inhibitor RaiA
MPAFYVKITADKMDVTENVKPYIKSKTKLLDKSQVRDAGREVRVLII